MNGLWKRIGTWLGLLGLTAGICLVFWMAFSSVTPSRPARLAPLPKAEELGTVLPLEPAYRLEPVHRLEQLDEGFLHTPLEQEEPMPDPSLYPTPEEQRQMEEEGLIVS
jgi:hypothetical protein